MEWQRDSMPIIMYYIMTVAQIILLTFPQEQGPSTTYETREF